MNYNELENMWYYFLELEKELAYSSSYVEPEGQEDVYSFHFKKLITLTCTEIETVFKAMCETIDNTKKRGSMFDYKGVILGKYPKIVDAEVHIRRWHKTVKPFEGWDTGKLEWWDIYQLIKHDRGANFRKATYKNAAISLSALYILIFYLYTINGKDAPWEGEYIKSDYENLFLTCLPRKKLPDFV